MGSVSPRISTDTSDPLYRVIGNIYKVNSVRKNRVFACFSSGNPLGSHVVWLPLLMLTNVSGFIFGSLGAGIASALKSLLPAEPILIFVMKPKF